MNSQGYFILLCIGIFHSLAKEGNASTINRDSKLGGFQFAENHQVMRHKRQASCPANQFSGVTDAGDNFNIDDTDVSVCGSIKFSFTPTCPSGKMSMSETHVVATSSESKGLKVEIQYMRSYIGGNGESRLYRHDGTSGLDFRSFNRPNPQPYDLSWTKDVSNIEVVEVYLRTFKSGGGCQDILVNSITLEGCCEP